MATERATVTVEKEGTSQEVLRHDHDCFGKVSVFKTQGSSTQLFGSALKHNQYVVVEVARARMDRHLNRDWVHEAGDIVRFSMSEAQWAQHVSSIGSGTGVPVTLEHAPPRGTRCAIMPGLEQDPVKETFEEEMRKSAALASEGIVKAQGLIAELSAPGRKPPTRKEMQELQDMLREAGAHFSGNMAFVQRSFAETMEKTVSAAKTEIEAFVGNMAMQTGLEVLRTGAMPTLLDGKISSDTDEG